MSGIVVAEGVVELVGDASDVTRSVERDIKAGEGRANAAGLGLGKSIFGGVLGAWAAIGGAQAVVGFFKDAVLGASDLNETASAAGQIFGSASQGVLDWGNTAAKSLGLSKQAAIESATSFGNMFTQLGWTSDAAADLSEKTVQVAADLGSFRNLPTADVSDRIAAAMRGEYDSLQALIPNINAARVEHEALAETGKKSASELTAQEKAQATLNIITQDGAAAMGDFARTADGAANKSKTVTAQFEDQKAKLGQQLLPAYQGLLGYLSNTVIPVFGQVVDWVGKNGETIGLLAGTIGGAVVAWNIYKGAVAVMSAYQTAAAASTGGLTVAQWLLNAAMSANPVGIIIIGLTALVGAIIWVATQTTFFQDTWKNVMDFIGTAWQWLYSSVIEPVGQFFVGVFEAIGAAFQWLYDNVFMPVVTGIMLYIGVWAGIFTWLWESVISPVLGLIGQAFGWLWENAIKPVFDFIGSAFQWLYDNVFAPVGGYIMERINAIGAVFTWLWENVANPVLSNLGMAFSYIWTNVIQPVGDFIGGAFRTIGDTVSSVFGGMAKIIGDTFIAIFNVIKTPINAIIGLINTAIDGLNLIKVTIPAWVPLVGGKVFSLGLPHIPLLAAGSNNAPDAFIAGERGPELITGAAGATVRPYGTTQDIAARGGLGGGQTINIESVVLDAKNVREFTDIVELIKALPQVARTNPRNA